MGKINLLSFEVANLIAAGEVVDRPASAIKEIMENSIDAGARRITVEINNGGSTFMRVSDDGCGMEPEDLPLAIRRHATSKIETAADLDGICTLGFRGEALAAISSVSHMRIISKTHESAMGAMLEADCGEIEEICEQGCSDGTTIIIEDLFANVPARRKFLKRDVTETAAILANVEKVALSHPEIGFRFIADGQQRLQTVGDGKLINTIYSIFGKDFATRLIPVEGEYEGIKISGFIGRSDNVKGNRNYQNFYINKRFVKSKTASAAIEQAFSSYLPSEKFPVCVLFIGMNPGRVDVNVHPAKLEVKFSNEKIVFEAIYYAVKEALESNVTRPQMASPTAKSGVRVSDAFTPVGRGESLKSRQISMDMPQVIRTSDAGLSDRAESAGFISAKVDTTQTTPQTRISAKEYLQSYIGRTQATNPVAKVDSNVFKEERNTQSASVTKDGGIKETAEPIQNDAVIPNKSKNSDYECVEDFSQTSKTIENAVSQRNGSVAVPEVEEVKIAETKPSWRIIGEAFNSYIIVELGEKMLMVDKHAAHERIIYEGLKANMYASGIESQLLMLPVEIMLMSDEVSAIEEYRGEIEAVGFEFSTSGNFIFVNAIPTGIEQSAVADMFAVFADRIKNGTGNVGVTRNIVFEKALYQASCKAAIKAGREYSDADNEWIIKRLMEIPDITFCPHGRPVAMELSKKNIDRQFERT